MNDRPVNREISYNGASQHFGNNIENNFFGDGFPINQQKKRYTNKKLVVPFTKEASNGSQGGTYVQRDDLLGKIESCFGSQSGNKRMVFLSGMGGCGKSELARAYGDKHSDEYEDIFWLTCRDGVKPELMRLIADADKLEEVKKADVNEFSDKVLIIVDNCNSDDDSFLFTLERSTGHADILVTTRRSRIGNYEEFLIPVESDDLEAFAYSVFEKNFCRKPRRGEPKKITDDDAVCVREICREVQYNTMMVSMIGIRLRENNDLSIPDCAREIRKGVGRLRGRIKYSKDLVPRSEEIKDILDFLFTDILSHQFTDEEKTILTILSLTPASWYAIDFIFSLCRGGKREPEYNIALMDLLDFGWLQGNSERISIHPLVAEALSYKQILAHDSIFFEGVVENYLGMSDEFLGRELFLTNKVLNLAGEIQSKTRLAAMLLINHGEYEKLFEELFPEVKAALFAYVNYEGNRQFLYRDLENDETHLLIDMPCQEKEEGNVALLKIINKGIPYKLDLRIPFCGKEIEKIPDGFCWRDHYLRELCLPNKLIDIGINTFNGCSCLSGELRLPESLTNIGEGAFQGCNGLSGELRLPEGLTSIGSFAFYGCSGLSLPERLTNIKEITSIKTSRLSGELKLPEDLTSIGNYAFDGCSDLSGELRLPESLTSIGIGAFRGCNGLSGELHLPKGLTSIGNSAFRGCSGLGGELRLPEGLISIGEGAFDSCSGLSGELYLPEGLTSIGDYTFDGCSGLSGELHLPKGLARIGNCAFRGCNGLGGELRLPESLTSIGSFAFYGCSGLSGELRLPEGLTSIGSFAFDGCSSLSGELHLPKGLTSIGDFAFAGCKEIKKMFFYDPNIKIPASLNPYASTVIRGYRNSTAEEYARTQGLVFVELEK